MAASCILANRSSEAMQRKPKPKCLEAASEARAICGVHSAIERGDRAGVGVRRREMINRNKIINFLYRRASVYQAIEEEETRRNRV
jgi:hypothetical protein